MSIVTIKASGLNSPINYEVGEERRKEREKEEGGRGREGGKEKQREKIPNPIICNHFGKPHGPVYLLKLNICLPPQWSSGSTPA